LSFAAERFDLDASAWDHDPGGARLLIVATDAVRQWKGRRGDAAAFRRF
jgi:hypothetical protein